MLEPDPRSGEPRAVHFKGRWVDGQRHGEGLERVGVSETRVEYACAPSPDSQPTTRAGGAALSLSCSLRLFLLCLVFFLLCMIID